MSYTVNYSDEAIKDLSKLGKSEAKKITDWVDKNLVGIEDPKTKGKALTGNLSGLWRYRAYDYRLIAEIIENEIKINMLYIGHRKDIYKKAPKKYSASSHK